MSLTLQLQGRSGKQPVSLSLKEASTTEELYKQLAAKTRLSVHRLRITTQDKKVAVSNDGSKTLSAVGLKDGETLLWKDLGPQISWRTVFLTEYIGPVLIHPIVFFYGHQLFYKYLPKSYASSGPVSHSKMQYFAFAMVMLHYIKRELETVFVHRFSNATMPWTNIIKNSAYYWGLSGIALAVPLYGPWASYRALAGTVQAKEEFLYPLLGTWLFCQASNLITHLILRSLRPASDPKRRAIPTGYGFEWITCANYFFEQLGWLVFSVMTLNPASFVFWAVGFAQMAAWAKKKDRNYKKEFGDKYPKNRWIMVPGLF